MTMAVLSKLATELLLSGDCSDKPVWGCLGSKESIKVSFVAVVILK